MTIEKIVLEDNKFFLNYCINSFEGRKTNNQLTGRPKEIYNEFLDGHDHIQLVLLATNEERINFLLLCALENGEY